MFLPLDRRLDWRRPPLATLSLALVCVLVFVVFQAHDAERRRAAHDYYYDSGLAEIELPRYRDWLASHGGSEFVERWGDRLADRNTPWLWRLETDPQFRRVLGAGGIVAAGADTYPRWRLYRHRFESLQRENVAYAWGFRPGASSWVTAVTHQFLHGGWFHLVGNMVFLVAVGLLLEVVAGPLLTAGLYLLGGLAAVGVFWLFDPNGLVPLVGASGAIAGLMGAMAVAYGMTRVRFFYTLGFWFDYVRAPAIVLLPLWFGKELLDWYLHGDASNIAFTAHMGGLAGGAALMLVARTAWPRLGAQALTDSEPASGPTADELLEEADRCLRRLELRRAARLYEALLSRGDHRAAALRGLYDSNRAQPAGDDFHAAAARVFESRGGELADMVQAVYADYRRVARPRPRLRRRSLQALSERFLAENRLDQAEELLRLMARHPDRFPDLVPALDRLVRQLRAAGAADRAAGWAQRRSPLTVTPAAPPPPGGPGSGP